LSIFHLSIVNCRVVPAITLVSPSQNPYTDKEREAGREGETGAGKNLNCR
jgi:hypothetical protein